MSWSAKVTLAVVAGLLVLLYFLGPVRSAQVDTVNAGTLSFRLRVEGDPDTLARVIASGRVLRARDGGRFSSSMDYDLVAQ